MKRNKVQRLGDLQLRILRVLWERGSATVGDVHEALGGSAQFAYTTVATMLRKMEARQLVNHDAEGRQFVYRATVQADEVTRSMADHLIERLFQGSVTGIVNHLLTTREVSPDELAELERLIKQRRRKS